MSEPITVTNGQNEIKIYTVQNRGRSIYQLSYYEGGRRQRQTFGTLPKARREAKITLGRMALVTQGVEKLSTSDMESYAVAHKKAAPTGLPVHVCVELYTQAHDILRGVPLLDAVQFYRDFHPVEIHPKSFVELIGQFADSRKAMGAHAGYVADLRRQLERLAKAHPGKTLAQFRTSELDQWLSSQSWSPVTKNNVRKHLITLGNWAKRNGYLPSNRPTQFEDTIAYKEPTAKVTIYRPADLQKLLAAVQAKRPELLPWLACGAFTGARIAELNLLRWEHINFERKFVEIASQKIRTKARRLVPLQKALAAWLLPYRQESGPINVYKTPHCVLLNVATKAGLELQDNGLRHSYISYRLAEINDTARVALEAGNSPDIIFQHYRELVSPEDAAAWFGVMPIAV